VRVTYADAHSEDERGYRGPNRAAGRKSNSGH